MPLQIIRQDITKMQVDAIVNTTNQEMIGYNGVDLAVHTVAGSELDKFCRELTPLGLGTAKITPAFNLPCKYIIHTSGPVWEGGDNGETELLVSCYNECLKLAKENNCETVAFPLISSGAYGYPKDKVLKIAISTISTFLFDNEMTVYLLVYDKKSYELSEKLFSGIESYIDDNYARRYAGRFFNAAFSREKRLSEEVDYSRAMSYECMSAPCTQEDYAPAPCSVGSTPKQSLEDFIKLDESFALKLIKLIDAKGISDVQCYKKANVSKQTWHKLMTDKHYKPNKKTAISFAVALELSLDETQNLLSSVGFILSDSNLFDVIIKYCLENKIYDVFEIDSALFKYDQETLFSKV